MKKLILDFGERLTLDKGKINFRPITEKDESILYDIFLSSRPDLYQLVLTNDSFSTNLIKQQFELSQSYMNKDELSSRYLISYEDEVAGKVFLRHGDTVDEIASIALLPKYRNMGIGSYVIEKIINNATENKKKIKLQVAWYNDDAKRLYKRLGFKEIRNHGVYVDMSYMA